MRNHQNNSISIHDAMWDAYEQAAVLARKKMKAEGKAPYCFKITKSELQDSLDKVAIDWGYRDFDAYKAAYDITDLLQSLVVTKKLLIAHNHEHFAAGAHGKVKLGSTREGELYAIKVEEINSSSNASQEAAIMEELKELTGFVNSFVHKNQNVIVMKYIVGDSLEDLKNRRYPLDEIPSLLVALGLNEALSQIHSRNVIHRDLKPSNILVDLEQFPEKLTTQTLNDFIQLVKNKNTNPIKIVDFGLSVKLENENKFATLPSKVKFARKYTAPEIHSDKKCSKESDYYSLGMVFKDLLLPPELIDKLVHREAPNEIALFESALKDSSTNGIFMAYEREIKRKALARFSFLTPSNNAGTIEKSLLEILNSKIARNDLTSSDPEKRKRTITSECVLSLEDDLNFEFDRAFRRAFTCS